MRKMISAFMFLAMCLGMVQTPASALPALLDRRPEAKQRESIVAQSGEVLKKLYASNPSAKSSVEKAYGYATFTNVGVKIFFAGSGTGRGLAVNNKTQEKTFMNMAELQAGLGIGIKNILADLGF